MFIIFCTYNMEDRKLVIVVSYFEFFLSFVREYVWFGCLFGDF